MISYSDLQAAGSKATVFMVNSTDITKIEVVLTADCNVRRADGSMPPLKTDDLYWTLDEAAHIVKIRLLDRQKYLDDLVRSSQSELIEIVERLESLQSRFAKEAKERPES